MKRKLIYLTRGRMGHDFSGRKVKRAELINFELIFLSVLKFISICQNEINIECILTDFLLKPEKLSIIKKS